MIGYDRIGSDLENPQAKYGKMHMPGTPTKMQLQFPTSQILTMSKEPVCERVAHRGADTTSYERLTLTSGLSSEPF